MAEAKPKKKGSSPRYKKYDVSSGTLKRKQSFCPKCGPGIFLAAHKNRRTCGKCGYMEKV